MLHVSRFFVSVCHESLSTHHTTAEPPKGEADKCERKGEALHGSCLTIKMLNTRLKLHFNYNTKMKDLKCFPVCGVIYMCSVVLLMTSCSLDVTDMI